MDIKDDELIQESYGKNPKPFWIWFGVLALFILGFLGIQWGLKEALEEKICESPFSRVTNREMSVFVWQNPEFMRANQKRKQGYMPAFQYLGKVSLEPELADSWVVAPPEVLFAYHTWNRILGGVWIPTPIEASEFREFLEYAEEWQPQNWDDAPRDYLEALQIKEGDIADRLPREVRLAFQGWQDFFKNGAAIQAVSPTYEELKAFLTKYPQYERSLWKNIVGDEYLKGEGSGFVPQDHLKGFLKAAFFHSSNSSSH